MHLSATEYRLLYSLASHADRVQTIGQLVEQVWADSEEEQIHVAQYISRLRAKLGDDTHNPNIIRTIRSFGYIFLSH